MKNALLLLIVFSLIGLSITDNCMNYVYLSLAYNYGSSGTVLEKIYADAIRFFVSNAKSFNFTLNNITNYCLDAVFYNDEGNLTKSYYYYQEMFSKRYLPLAPSTSAKTINVVNMAEDSKFPFICISSDPGLISPYQYTYSMLPISVNSAVSLMNPYRTKIGDIAIIGDPDYLASKQAISAARDFLLRAGYGNESIGTFEIKGYINSTYSTTNDTSSWTEHDRQMIRNAAKYIVDLYPNFPSVIVHLHINPYTATLFMDELKKYDKIPSIFFQYGEPPYVLTDDLEKDVLPFVTFITNTHEINNAYRDSTFSGIFANYTDWRRSFIEQYPQYKDTSTVNLIMGYFSYLRGVLFLKALHKLETDDYKYLNAEISRTTLSTTLGDFFWDETRFQQRPQTLIQHHYYNNVVQDSNNVAHIVFPQEVADTGFVFPMPTWEMRNVPDQWGKPEIGLSIISGFFALISIVWIGVVITYRKETIWRITSPSLTIISIMGSLFLYASINTWTFYFTNQIQCYLRILLMDYGYLLMFTIFYLKMYRIITYSRITEDVYIIKDSTIGIIVGIVLLIHTILIITLIAAGGVKIVLIPSDSSPYDLSSYYNDCSFDSAVSKACIYTILIFNGIMALLGSILAYRIRKQPFEVFNESTIIAIAVYNTFVISIVVLILSLATSRSEGVYIARSILILIGTFSTVNIYMFHKVSLWNNPKKKSSDSPETNETNKTGSKSKKTSS